MKILQLTFLLLNLAGAALYAADATIVLTEEQFKNLGVVLGKPQPVRQVPLLNAPAQVVVPPEHEYIVSAAQAGLITKLHAAVGDAVEKGQILAAFNSSDLLMLEQQYLQAVSERHLAGSHLRRDKQLHEAGVISESRWHETSSMYEVQVSAENEAKQLLVIAGMSDADIKRLAATRRLSSDLQLRAPADGVVLARMVRTGERVAAQQPLYRIANLDELWLEIAIPQQRARDVKPGDGVTVENSDVTARITLLGRSVDPQTQTVLARAAVIGQPTQIRAGQTLQVHVAQPSSEVLFKLPNTAIALNAGQAYVFSRNAGGFSVKPVKVIGRQGHDAFVAGALQADENIAVNGAVALKANWLGLGGGEE
ncbi:MAG: efflux RND transporter periplasmic adaptor subunit [Gammaproteobacteria bacterium]